MLVFTTELVAILWAVGWDEEGKIIIFSDSTAALMALNGGKSGTRPDLIVEILTVLNRVSKLGNTVGLYWVPGQVGVQGNEEADKTAKRAVNSRSGSTVWKG